MSNSTSSSKAEGSSDTPSVSFVLPALNECEHIKRSIESIRHFANSWLNQVIVVDNGSVDGTPEIARAAGAKVILFPEGTVAAARNHGVAQCTGELLVFLDADVSLTSEWKTAFPAVLESLALNPQQVTGSRCAPVGHKDFLTRFWFDRLAGMDARYVNSGHLITTRALFDAIGGFDAGRETAEDYDFCMRASAVGALVVNNEKLLAIHHDYPSTPAAFIFREAWHGRDDFKDAASLRASRIGLIVCLNLTLLLLCLLAATVLGSLAPILVYFALAALMVLAMTIIKFGWSLPVELFGTSIVFALYMCGRTLSLMRMLSERILKPRTPSDR